MPAKQHSNTEQGTEQEGLLCCAAGQLIKPQEDILGLQYFFWGCQLHTRTHITGSMLFFCFVMELHISVYIGITNRHLPQRRLGPLPCCCSRAVPCLESLAAIATRTPLSMRPEAWAAASPAAAMTQACVHLLMLHMQVVSNLLLQWNGMTEALTAAAAFQGAQTRSTTVGRTALQSRICLNTLTDVTLL